jgi:hypothetical protein
MAFLRFRTASPSVPTADETLTGGLTSAQIDGNFKSLNDTKLDNATDSQQNAYFGDIHLIDDIAPSNYLKITNSANLTDARTLSIDVNNNNRTITLAGDLNVQSSATVSGINTGDQINITGNANTATTLQSARAINGTTFNGSADITTSNWGASRSVTIGSTAKTVNGSSNVSWSLAEIGAAVVNQTMFIGTTQVAINRSSGSLALSGISSIDGSAATFTSTTQNSQFNSIGVGTAASGTAGEIRATNNITAYYSDDRLKTRIRNIENALEKIVLLNGFYYEANETAQALGYQKIREVGVSAQEVQKVLPEVVTTAPISDEYLTVRYERMIPLLIEAIKELKNEIENLKRGFK